MKSRGWLEFLSTIAFEVAIYRQCVQGKPPQVEERDLWISRENKELAFSGNESREWHGDCNRK
jgi:hypothetical protein